MMSSHLSLHTLSRSIKPYASKAKDGFVIKPQNAQSSENLALKELKNQLQDKTKSIEKLIGFLEDVTWLDIPDDQTRNAIVDLVQIAKLYYSEELAFGASLHISQKKDIEAFFIALDDLKEMIQDVESAIITLPKLDGFNEIFDELSRL